MGRLIDADKVRNEYIHAITLDMDAADLLDMLCNIIDNAPTVEAVPKDQYEARLKADLVAMLTELQLEIQELWDNDPSYIEGVYDSEMLIQQKIDKLKEQTDGNDEEN